MKNYPNFYEHFEEACARLNRTVVLYDNLPYFILAITNHIDAIFRVYLEPIGIPDRAAVFKDFYHLTGSYTPDHPDMGPKLDALLEATPECGILRKHINSPYFNRFYPFPLGMCNVGTQVYYIERQPIRPLMHQGLIKQACWETLVTTGSRQDNPTRSAERFELMSPSFKDCVLGDHFPPEVALNHLRDPFVANDALAIHREFALVRGPLDIVFLAYRTDIIGLLSNHDFSLLRLGNEYGYCKEVVEELHIFKEVL
jgi:hypothetical protein